MEVVIPENIKDITLSQYQELENLRLKENLTEYEVQKIVVSIFTKINHEHIEKIAKKDFENLYNDINKALNVDAPFEQTFEFRGVEYGFIPNLDNCTSKEWFDFQLYPLTKTETLHKLMAILFRPITKKDSFKNYKIESYNGTGDRAELFKELPMNIVNGAIGFFLTLQKQLLAHILKYTKAEQPRGDKRATTLVNGDGMQL